MRAPLLASLLLIAAATTLRAQQSLENVIVELYYVSDANDATDVIGGGLVEGSRTYRVYLDLCEGCGLRAVYGDANHPLSISSTALFFNHADRGRAFGHQINNAALGEGTAALDSYLSLGRGSTQRLGILKADDPDGSGVGGSNNDGGSALVPGGLLVNSTTEMGSPLTATDGLVPLSGAPGVPTGFLLSGEDPGTAFGDETVASGFLSNSTRISAAFPGVTGPTADNRVLVAQLTTAGELTFLLNVEVQRPDGSVQKYVSTGDTLLPGETLNGLLVYPPDCGCTDPDFLEFDPAAGCDDGSCATAIVLGCLDPAACNYSTSANFNVPQLCCYSITDCNGLDPYIVCPTIGMDERIGTDLLVAPNPTAGAVRIGGAGRLGSMITLEIADAAGRSLRKDGSPPMRDGALELDLSDLANGIYVIAMTGDRGRAAARIIKH
jgi:hypothetical protein